MASMNKPLSAKNMPRCRFKHLSPVTLGKTGALSLIFQVTTIVMPTKVGIQNMLKQLDSGSSPE
jgi:hypothetical protein